MTVLCSCAAYRCRDEMSSDAACESSPDVGSLKNKLIEKIISLAVYEANFFFLEVVEKPYLKMNFVTLHF